MLSNKQITRYQTIYKKRFGVEISREEAYEQGIRLFRLIEIIYKPITKSDIERLHNFKQNYY